MALENQKFYERKLVEASPNTLFDNAYIIDVENNRVFKGQVLVSNGFIKEIIDLSKDKKIEKSTEVNYVDCKNLHLAPALIDAQVHIGEPGGDYKENLYLTSRSAVAGGVATINIMPDTKPVIDTTALYEFIKNRAVEKSFCDITIFGSITKNLEGKELSEMGLLKKAGIKGVSDCGNSIYDSLVFKRACEYASNFDLTISHQPSDKFLSENAVLADGFNSTTLGVQGVPDISEKIGLERDLAIIEYVKAKYHCLNISTKKAIETIKNSKNKGLKITSSTTPEYFSFTDEEAKEYRTFAKLNPPLRSENDRFAIIEGLKNGAIDFISSNHSPRSVDQKRLPLQSAEFGVVGLETMLSASYTYLIKEGFELPQIFKLLSKNPAEYLGLKGQGAIKKGYKADLIIVDFSQEAIVNPLQFAGKAVNSLYDGIKLMGGVVKTFVSGKLVYEKN
ncbi:MAG: dihydroorotase [Rickettsiales bacterium]|nr:dihydroorotase [Rickettsiales bacterium]